MRPTVCFDIETLGVLPSDPTDRAAIEAMAKKRDMTPETFCALCPALAQVIAVGMLNPATGQSRHTGRADTDQAKRRADRQAAGLPPVEAHEPRLALAGLRRHAVAHRDAGGTGAAQSARAGPAGAAVRRGRVPKHRADPRLPRRRGGLAGVRRVEGAAVVKFNRDLTKDDLDPLGIFTDVTPEKLTQLCERWATLAYRPSRETAAERLVGLANEGATEEELAPLRAWVARRPPRAVQELAEGLLAAFGALLDDEAEEQS